MTRIRSSSGILLGALLALSPAIAAAQGAVAFTHVSVIPMDRERVLPDQTVLVRGGRIVSIGPAASVQVPADARRVDGTGRFLIPGLADMHAHLLSDGAVPDSVAPDELRIMLANGVTTARLMIGTPEQFPLRAAVARGEVPGPTLFLASPQFAGRVYGDPRHFNGRAVATPEQARAAVREVHAAGYDFVKLTVFISPAVYDAVVDEAARLGIRVIGHVDPQVGLARALAAGQQIEHLAMYLEAALRDGAPMTSSVSDYFVYRPANWESLDWIDDAKIDSLGRATAAAGVWTSPTLTFFKLAFGVGQPDEEVRARPDFAVLPDSLRRQMFEGRDYFWRNPPSAERRARYVEARNRMVRAIWQAGGRILAGSDSPELFLVYGWTLHRELESLVEAGLTPWAALEAATRNPAEWLGTLAESGTVEPGKRADLVLLDANPLADIRNTQRIAGVMRAGRWYPAADLARMIDESSARIRNSLP
ncbi:MAG TPA: amidohydrolase family protein [Longimicrobium sp.]|nr:amidohydrolase family protein [Longimicrobium sp.]